jgi:hypothetical protein
MIMTASCSDPSGRVVATMDGAVVTWEETIEAAAKATENNESDNQALAAYKTLVGDSIILPRLLALEAMDNLQELPQIKKRLRLVEEESIIQSVEQEAIKKLRYSATVYKAFFTAVEAKENTLDNSSDTRRFAEELLEKVMAVEDRESYLDVLETAKSTEQFTLEWGMKEWFLPGADPYLGMVDFSTLKPGSHVPYPVQVAPAGFVLLYIQDSRQVTHKTITRELPDEKHAAPVHNHFIKLHLSSLIDHLESLYQVDRNYSAFESRDPDAIALSIKPHVSYTVSDILYRMGYSVADEKARANPASTFTLEKEPDLQEKIGFTEGILKENSLLIYRGLDKEITKTSAFKMNYQQKFDRTFAAFYMYDIAKIDFNPTQEETLLFYQNDPFDMFINMKLYREQGRMEKIPYAEAKDQAATMLKKANYESHMSDVKKELFNRYNVTFIEEAVNL